jgi:hypothetical protein
MRKFYSIFALGLALLVFSLSPAFTADSQGEVARVSLIRGNVSNLRGDTGDWVATVVNTPLVAGDAISTGPNSRAEIQLDFANILRLDQNTQAKIAALSPSQIQIQVSQGLVDYVILQHTDSEIEIDAPNAAIHPFADGIYRLQVNSDSEMLFTVRRGQAQVSTPQGSTTVQMGQLITVEGADNPEYQISEAPPNDDWDRFNQTRDTEILRAESAGHANAYYVGAGELGAYGHWVFVPGYGWCWTPNGGPGWIPYANGRWVWEPYWGWTWVSYDPWGWAPYHYGRWFFWGSSWVWWPGPVTPVYRPVYAPAYVSFVGFGFGGRNWSFGFGFGYQRIGWVPIGPSDPYYPWWGARNTYQAVNFTNVTRVTNVTNITNVYNTNQTVIRPLATSQQPAISNVQALATNAHVRQALVTMPAQQFVSSRAPARPEPVSESMLRQAEVIRGTVPVVPTRQSLQPVNRAPSPSSIPREPISQRRFFAQSRPPVTPPPFAQSAASVRAMVQKPVQPLAQGGRGPAGHWVSAPANTQFSARQNAETAARPGWQRFGEPRRPSNAGPQGNLPQSGYHPAGSDAGGRNAAQTRQASDAFRPAQRSARPGWHKFGENGSGNAKSARPGRNRGERSRPSNPDR